jgi:acyl-CoA synthetase (NDP forming)
MVDVDAADVIDYLAADPATKVIGLHLEGVSYGRKLYQTLARVTPRKPVVALAVGRADVGEFAASHTGNLIGSHARKVAALEQAGAVVVSSTDDLVDACAILLHGRIPAKAAPGIAIVTGQAGPGLIIADQLKTDGVALPELGAATIATLDTLLPPLTFYRNPVDTGRPGPSFEAVMQAVAADPAIDAIACFTLNEPAAVDPAAVLGAVINSVPKPIAFGTMGTPDAIAPTLAALAASGIAAFTSPDRLARAVSALAADARAAWRARHSVSPARGALHPRPPLNADVDEAQAKALLADYGIATPQRVVCMSAADARAAMAKLGVPVVAKILSTEIAHKTEAGGVIVNIKTDAELSNAIAQLDRIPLRGARRYLIEAMAPAGLELIVGAVRDPSFGPTIAIGLGGVLAEALDDVAIRLAPVSMNDALEMLGKLKAHVVLNGWRGAPAVDKTALAQAIVAVGELMLDQPDILELDLNPVRAYPSGVLALDALIVRNVHDPAATA